MRRLFAGVGAGLMLMIATACGGSAATNPPPATTAASAPAAASVAASAGGSGVTCAPTAGSGQMVGITNFTFSPGSLTVSSGTTVTWTNNDSVDHTVSFDSGPDCGTVSSGKSVNAVFAAPGTYAYHCKIHPSMKGSITVS